tara:strand:- start:1328 stop:3496 length:2169 start_codon:yes stop_codon:yes gene_type:complete
MILLAKSFTKEQCQKLNIPEEFAFENMIQLNKKDLYDKFYNPRNSQNCVVRYLREKDMFGYTKDLPFQIKNPTTLEFMYNKISKITSEEIMNTYDLVGDIYEHFINREGKTMKDLGQYFTDRTLIRYLVDLCDPQVSPDYRVPSVWDPSAGTGGFLIEYIHHMNKQSDMIDWSIEKSELHANDINKNTYSLLKQNMYYSLREGSGSTINLMDSLITNDDQMYDFILANPPFGIKGLKYKDMCEKVKNLGINGTKGEILFLQLCMAKLKDNGKCAIVVPEGVLFNSTKMYKETRKYLLENFNLKRIIKIGEGEFFKNTGVKTSVFFFEKSGKTENIEFIQVNKVDDTIEEVPLMTVEMHKIIENDYSLNMNLYKEIVLDVNEDFEVVELGNIFTLEKGTISATNTSNTGEYQVISVSDKRTHNEYTNEGETLAICGHGGGSTKLQYTREKCILTSLMYELKTDIYKYNKKYMYYYLKENMEEIKKVVIKGACQPSLNFEIFNKIKIPVPPLEVQNRIVEQLDNIYETEIESSKEVIKSLQFSIETIMKNTMYLDDLVEYKINDVCEFKGGKRITKKEHTGTTYPVYGGGNISFYTDEPNNRDGFNIVLSIFGSSGKITLVNGPMFLHDNACSVNSTNKKLNDKYLGNYLHSFNEHIYSYKRQTGVPTLDIDSFKNYKIRIPPSEIQREILRKIEPKERLINQLEKNINRAEKEAKEIMNILFN